RVRVGRRGVVLAVHRHGHRGRARAAVAVTDGVGEGVGGSLDGCQVVKLDIGVVCYAGAVVGHRAQGPGRVHAGDRQGVRAVRIGVVRPHASAVFPYTPLFRSRVRVGRRGVVLAVHRHGHRGRARAAVAVTDGVGEG